MTTTTRKINFNKILDIATELCAPQTMVTVEEMRVLITKAVALAIALVTRIVGIDTGARDIDPLVEQGLEMYRQAEE